MQTCNLLKLLIVAQLHPGWSHYDNSRFCKLFCRAGFPKLYVHKVSKALSADAMSRERHLGPCYILCENRCYAILCKTYQQPQRLCD